MRGQLVQVLQVVSVGEAAVQAAAEALSGLSGVLGDVASHLLRAQLPGLVIGSGDVVDVELLTPARIPLWLAVLRGRAGHPDGGDGQPQGVLENGGGEALGRRSETAGAAAVGGRVQA